MTIKYTQDDGTEIEVYTAEEVTARETAARTAVEGEWKPKAEKLETDLTEARKNLAQRTQSVVEFRKLSDEQVAKLEEKDRIIYENQLALSQERAKGAEADKKAYENAVTAAIRAKVGADQKLFDKVKGAYDIIGLDDSTVEGITARVGAALGVLGSTEPDLLASAGFSVGAVEPPKPKAKADETFSDSERGKAGAAELGIALTEEEVKKKMGIK